MSTTVESFSVPVDVPYREAQHGVSQNLQDRVLQIIQQKGHFRHVTEQSLLSQDEEEDEEGSKQSQDVEETSPQKVEEKLMKSRDDMLHQLDRAQNDNLVALETISFLLSKHTTSGKATMSDELKKRAPVGTLDSKLVQARHLSDTKSKQIILNSQGWRSKGFGAAFQTLSAASTRLREEAEREAKYWAEVSKLRETGTIISRYPRDSAVAIHFGAPNSSPRFRQQGVALLRQDASSGVYLDRRPRSQLQNRLQVQIYRGTALTGTHSFTPRFSSEETDIAKAIKMAQTSLLEEEMFHEMGREARASANQDIATRGQTISFSVDDACNVSLALTTSVSDLAVGQSKDRDFAEYIDLSLRTILQDAHSRSYVQRTRTPPPLLAQPRQPEEQMILRPLIASLRHQASIHHLRSWIENDLLAPIRRAGMDIDWQTSEEGQLSQQATSHPQRLLSAEPSRSSFSLILPSQRQIHIQVVSSLLPPVHGTQYEISALRYESTDVSAITIQNLADFHDALTSRLKLDLAFFAASVSKDTADKNDQDSAQAKWQVSRLHGGELSLVSKKSRKAAAGMRIDLHEGILVLRLAPSSVDYFKGKKVLSWSWSSHAGSVRPTVYGRSEDVGINKTEAGKLSFSEVVTQSTKITI